jgi:hypothetical protein
MEGAFAIVSNGQFGLFLSVWGCLIYSNPGKQFWKEQKQRDEYALSNFTSVSN